MNSLLRVEKRETEVKEGRQQLQKTNTVEVQLKAEGRTGWYGQMRQNLKSPGMKSFKVSLE